MTGRSWLALGFGTMLALGVGLIVESAPPPRAAKLVPLPDASAATPTPSGPSVAKVDGQQLSAGDMAPGTLFIPAIGVYTRVMDTPRRGNQLVVPASATSVVRWDESAPLQAAHGNTVLAGHVAFDGTEGIFGELGSLELGAQLFTTDSAGEPRRYILSARRTYAKSIGLPKSVWSTSTRRTITVVSCTGKVTKNGASWHWSDNLVLVFIPT